MGLDIRRQAKAAREMSDEGVVIHVTNADESLAWYEKNGEQHPVTITVAGSHSKLYRRVESEQRAERLKPRNITGQKFHEDALDRAVACTLAWEGLDIDGVPIPFTAENVRMVYAEAPWIYDLVSEAIHDTKRFFSKELQKQQNSSGQGSGSTSDVMTD